eukprot:TRINITY_DN2385_c0_g1_i1.p1 TRINITY_DN2385_c0_g1~~TRINITY_DN2385_c0_g1_i1.p1  ORF type:complete len:110 (-),score=14.15 TRINITY_DN2385_c0_g1_i1:85-414(-)
METELPMMSCARVVKSVVPPGTAVSKDARQAFTKAASMFVFYLSTMASDKAKANKRTTVSAQDVVKCLQEMDYKEISEKLAHFGAKPEKKKRVAPSTKAPEESAVKKPK